MATTSKNKTDLKPDALQILVALLSNSEVVKTPPKSVDIEDYCLLAFAIAKKLKEESERP